MQAAVGGTRAPGRAPRSLVYALALLAAACGQARQTRSPEVATGADALCTRCHGNGDNAAPPQSAHGATDWRDPSVGAHQAHVKGGALAGPVPCQTCHVVPATVDAPGHMDSDHATVTFGGLAIADGAAPRWARETLTCSGTYCHGATLTRARGSNLAPVWNAAGQADCGGCHAAPPPGPHPQNPACQECHPATVRSDGTIDVAGGKHVDGKLEVSCSGCHGSDESPAPPRGTHGETETTALAVGAHQAHLQDGPVRRALDCAECHPLPDGNTHANGRVDFAWGALATADGAAPAFDAQTATCASTYCHGATLHAGGAAVAPVWTQVDGTQRACDACHGYPPPPPHPANLLCNGCHPLTVAVDGSIDLAGGHHVDGIVDVAALTCSSCHGSDASPAPPVGTRGETATTALAVGAHQAHLRDGPFRKALACAECHAVPAELRHANGTVELVWGPLATAGNVSPTFDPADATCASTWCHGAKLRGGSVPEPVWTEVDGTQAACGACHGNPPGDAHPRAQPGSCSPCHPSTVKPDGTIDLEGGHHIDGKLDAAMDCAACHDAPPRTGAHLAHAAFPTSTLATYGDLRIFEDYGATGATTYTFGCGNCHPTDPAKHLDGTVEVELSPDVDRAALRARNAPDAAFDAATRRCDGVYCHSSGQATPRYVRTPGWTSGTKLGCGGCHGNPPAYASGGAGAPDANGHLGLGDTGREFGHFAGLGGPNHDTKHGGGVYGGSEAAAPITCQTCHFETTDPANVGPSGFYWLDTTGSYALAGGDPARRDDPRWRASQCSTCHGIGGAPVGQGEVLPLRHVNGRRDVVFDARAALPGYAGLPAAPDRPSRPYWLTHVTFCDPLPAGAALDGTTMSADLSGARWDPETKTCSSVPCHLTDSPVWGRGYRAQPGGDSSCCRCHGPRCGGR